MTTTRRTPTRTERERAIRDEAQGQRLDLYIQLSEIYRSCSIPHWPEQAREMYEAKLREINGEERRRVLEVWR